MNARWIHALWFGLLVGGCGDGEGGGAEADAAVEVDATPQGTCTIEAIDSASEGQPVVFSHPDGALIGSETLVDGAAGRDDCVDGTIITLTTSGNRLTSIAGVGRDATVRWGTGLPTASGGDVAVTVNWASEPPADQYEVTIGCAPETVAVDGVPAPIETGPLCSGNTGTDVDVLAAAVDAEGVPLSFSYVANVTLSPPTTNVDMSAAAWSPSVLRSIVTVEGYDPDAGAVVTGSAAVADNVELWTDDGLDSADLDGGATTFLASSLPPELHEHTVIWSRVQRYMGGPISAQRQYTQVGDARTLDLGTLLPSVSKPIFTKETPTRPVVRWSFDGDLSAVTGVYSRVRWDDAAGDPHDWSFVIPAGLEFQLPELPDDLAAQRPEESATLEGTVLIFHESWRDYATLIGAGTFVPALALLGLGAVSIDGPSGSGQLDLSISPLPRIGGGIIIE